MEGIGATAKYLFVCTSNGVEMIDLESGEVRVNQDILNEYFYRTAMAFPFPAWEKKLFLHQGKTIEVYFCNNKGLYRFVVGGNVVEQVINGELNSISSPGVYFKSLIAVIRGSFIFSRSCKKIMGGIKLLRENIHTKMMCWMPDTGIQASMPWKTALSLRQIISTFQKAIGCFCLPGDWNDRR